MRRKRNEETESNKPVETTDVVIDVPPPVGLFAYDRRSNLPPEAMASYLTRLSRGALRIRPGGKREPIDCCYCYTRFDDPEDGECSIESSPLHKIVNDGSETIEMQLFDALTKVRDALTRIVHEVAARHRETMVSQLPLIGERGWPMLRAGIFKEGKLERTVLFADPREEFCRLVNEQDGGQVAHRLQSELPNSSPK
ncbi:hypothetical protein [Anatilimnocola floriformis]|uniref:hypothetical protein n=1 Tax=Anatilimnocola floriformis TaxID=2948575 RepID=UPI0020C471DD|nr:hypothetical protein [Anatilimnocola floriformis]